MNRYVVCLSICAVCLLINLAAPAVTAQKPMHVRLSEKSLRARAIKSVMPAYPDESKKRGSKGVAVARLEIDEQGDVTQVDVLESPDAHIKRAVTEATSQWKFNPTTVGGQPVRVQGKLTFYFVIEGADARVENPKDT
jgi:protein TonB